MAPNLRIDSLYPRPQLRSIDHLYGETRSCIEFQYQRALFHIQHDVRPQVTEIGDLIATACQVQQLFQVRHTRSGKQRTGVGMDLHGPVILHRLERSAGTDIPTPTAP